MFVNDKKKSEKKWRKERTKREQRVPEMKETKANKQASPPQQIQQNNLMDLKEKHLPFQLPYLTRGMTKANHRQIITVGEVQEDGGGGHSA